MKTIVAVDKNWGIGKDNALLVHLPGDLKYFKEQTLGKVLVHSERTTDIARARVGDSVAVEGGVELSVLAH